MKRKWLCLFLCLTLCFVLAGCGSDAQEETVDEIPVVEPAPVPEPSPAPAPAPEPAPVEDTSAADALRKAEALNRIEKARAEAVSVSADKLLPDQFASVDAGCAKLVAGAQDMTVAEVEAAADEAICYYDTLNEAARGYVLYDEIVENEYDAYAPVPFSAAMTAVDELAALWDAGAAVGSIAAKTDEAYGLLEKTIEEGRQGALTDRVGKLTRQMQYFRNEALASGIASVEPDALAYVDSRADEACAAYGASHDLAAFEKDAAAVCNGYKALALYVPALDAYDIITEKDWFERDPERIARAEAAADEFVSMYENGDSDLDAYYLQASIVYESLRKVVDDCFKNDSDACRAEYMDVKKQADAIKANVAAKAAYAAAAKRCTEADAAYSRGTWDSAYEAYAAALADMTQVFETVSQKRSAAQAAMDRAQKEADAVDAYALEADEIAPLGDEEAL